MFFLNLFLRSGAEKGRKDFKTFPKELNFYEQQ